VSERVSDLLRQDNLKRLSENPYPGRGIVLGLNSRGDEAQQVYWVMGRSENSRNRVLVREGDVVSTAPYDASKVIDPSLIIYNAMRIAGNTHVVSNGDQTDTIVESLENGQHLWEALQTRTYEPDAPNYTPRISGLIKKSPASRYPHYDLSIIRRSEVTGEPQRIYSGGSYDIQNEKGAGHCIHTYKGDGEPLPSFTEPPYKVPLGETTDETAETYWKNLNKDNRVALVVKGIRLATGEVNYRIINAHEEKGEE
jgi:IMP cyclohydrolase